MTNQKSFLLFKMTFIAIILCFSEASYGQISTYKFTTAGQAGRKGPTQSLVNTAYTSTNLSGKVTVSGGIQKWVVPQSGIYRIKAYGSQGGSNGSYNGGKGAYVEAEYLLYVGDTINILVGQHGENLSNYNTGGGGGSFAWISGQTTEPLLAAGGGGGAGYSANGVDADTAKGGTNGTGSSNYPGTNGNGAKPGGAGWKSDGGDTVGNTGCTAKCSGGSNGVAHGGASPLSIINLQGCAGTTQTGDGGFGGGGGGNGWCTSSFGGGGGGGYSGGAGNTGASTGGGGGGSFISSTGSNPKKTRSVQSGDGEVFIELINLFGASNDAGIRELILPSGNFCHGVRDISVKLVNYGNNSISGVKINWSINGTLQTAINYTNTLDTFGSPNKFMDTVLLGNYNFSSSSIDLKVWTSDPNSKSDTSTYNDTLWVTLTPSLSGNFTIGGSGADFASFKAATDALNTYGICGPVKFNISSGTYSDRLVLGQIVGASPTNTITFDGGSKSTTTIQHSGTSTADWQTVLLDDADYITIKNLTIKGTGSYAIGVHLTNNADYNTISNCSIEVSTTSTSTNVEGIVGSGSRVSYSTTGNPGEYNNFDSLTISGGYYGVYYTGFGSTSTIMGSAFTNINVSNHYNYGINLQYLENPVLSNCNVSKGRASAAYGLRVYYCLGPKVLNNFAIGGGYGMYFYGNNSTNYNKERGQAINNMTIGGYYAWYGYNADYIDYYHNSFHTDDYDAAFVGSYGDSLDIRNNIFSNLSSTSTYEAVWLVSATFKNDYLDYNVYYTPNGAGVAERTTAYSSLSAWQSAESKYNQNSYSEDPGFISSTDLHLTTGTKPFGLDLGITTDIDGDPRCPHSPSIGADESDKGRPGDPLNPEHICTGSTIVFDFSPPKGMTNADYGTKWTISSITFETAGGTGSTNTSTVYPSSSAAGKFTFSPTSSDAGKTYLLTIVVSNSVYSACDSTYTEYVEVHTPSVASYTVNNATVCRGTPVTFTNTSTGATEYKWYLDNGLTKTDTSFTYNYPNEGTYTVSLVSNNPGCKDSITKTIIVQGPPTGAILKEGTRFDGYFFNGTPNDPDLTCVRDTLMYEIVPPPAFTNSDYGTQWEVSAHSVKSTGGASSPNYSFTAPSSSGAGYFTFTPKFAEADLTFIMNVSFRSLNTSCKDTTVVRYISVSTSPTAGFNISGQCVGKPTLFTDASTVAPGLVVRRYEFGANNAFATTANPSYTYNTAGEYTVTYTVTGKGGCDDVLKKKITIYDEPTADFDVPPTVCAGNPAAFMSTSTGNGTTITRYKWTFNQGATPDTSNQANVAYTFTAPGSYNATLQVWTDGGCNSSVTKNITVVDAPKAAFPLTKGCINEPITFVNNSTDAVSYEWRFSDKDTIRTKDAVKTFKFKSSYSVTLVATSASGCRDSVTRQIEFHDQPEVDFTSTGNCAGRPVDFRDATTFPTPSSSAVEWTWTIEGQKKSGDKTTHTFATAGTYNVKLKVESNYGCTDSFTGSVTINPAPVAGMTLPGSACVNVASTFENTSTGTGNSYLWHFGDGETSIDENPMHTYDATGTYIVKLVTTNGTGCKDSVTEQLTVGLGPEVPFKWCAKGKVVTFEAENTSYATYEWEFGDILNGTGTGTNPTYTYLSANGEYTVILTVTDAAGCVGTHSATVGTGNADNSTNCEIGIEGMSAQRLSMNIYPNPFSHSTLIEYELLRSQQVRVSVWDATGKEVAVLNNGLQQAGKQQLTLDANEHKLPAGLYMIRIETEGAVAASQVLRLK